MSESDYTHPSEMDDEELYDEYQDAKQNGPVPRIDELQLEIAERWEEERETLREWQSALEHATRKLSKGTQFPGAQGIVRKVQRQMEANLEGKDICQECEGSGSGVYPHDICQECEGSGFENQQA